MANDKTMTTVWYCFLIFCGIVCLPWGILVILLAFHELEKLHD